LFIIDDIINAVGAGNAAASQERAANLAMAQQAAMHAQGRADMMPWLEAGKSSLADMLKMTQGGYDASAMANDPGFQFRMAEGQKALERSASARGGLNSGGFMKGLANYSQGLASQEYGNRFGRLAQLAGLGHSSAQNMGAQGANYANSMSSLLGALGNAQAAGAVGVANGISGGFKSLGNLAMIGMGGGFPGMSGLIPTQGASTGYTSNYMPPYGFGLNNGGY
jgi:hypothetical protein